jgi:hypothetical protein
MSAVFNDPRSAFVPAHLLARDRYDADAAASALHIPSLWLENLQSASATQSAANSSATPQAYIRISTARPSSGSTRTIPKSRRNAPPPSRAG